MATLAGDIINFLVKLGLYDVILPFVLVFSISYGILERNKVLGDNKNASSMISFVLGFIVVATANILDLVNFAVTFFVLTVIGLIGMLTIVKFVNKDWKPGDWPLGVGFAFLIAIILVLFADLIDYKWIEEYVKPLLPALIFLALIALVVWVVIRKPGKKSSGTHEEKDKRSSEKSSTQKSDDSEVELEKVKEIKRPKGKIDIN
ncbi:hypothetical protein HZA97_04525 [Candidatus Woesearchaeota archaeon]|nr:hypothetical protein [Candidatus Woesearchaeota archaeon]